MAIDMRIIARREVKACHLSRVVGRAVRHAPICDVQSVFASASKPNGTGGKNGGAALLFTYFAYRKTLSQAANSAFFSNASASGLSDADAFNLYAIYCQGYAGANKNICSAPKMTHNAGSARVHILRFDQNWIPFTLGEMADYFASGRCNAPRAEFEKKVMRGSIPRVLNFLTCLSNELDDIRRLSVGAIRHFITAKQVLSEDFLRAHAGVAVALYHKDIMSGLPQEMLHIISQAQTDLRRGRFSQASK